MLNIFSIFNLTYSALSSFVSSYGYFAILILMILESASMPIPSELLLPATGYFAAKGVLNIYIALVVVYVSSFIGMAINYYIAYLLGKDFVYKHLHWFRIKKEDVEAFERWFDKNGPFTVFISRLLPIVRGFINFPAGFALMNQKKFYTYSMAGTIIWDTALVMFGYYGLAAHSITNVLIAIGVFGVALYTIYRIAINNIKGSKDLAKN